MPPPNLLSTYLADTDEPCPGCNYNLRGLTTPICPECNQTLTLRVAVKEPRLAWFLVAIIGLTLGIGSHGLLFVLLIIGIVRGYVGNSGIYPVVATITASLAILLFAAATLLSLRRRFARRSRRKRAALALGACTLTIASFIALAVVSR